MLRPLVSLIALSLFVISSSAFADARGEMLFGQHCVACHQFGGKGGIGLPLTPGKMENVDDLYLIRTIQLGRPGRVMPAFTELILMMFVRSLITCDPPRIPKVLCLKHRIYRAIRRAEKVSISCIA